MWKRQKEKVMNYKYLPVFLGSKCLKRTWQQFQHETARFLFRLHNEMHKIVLIRFLTIDLFAAFLLGFSQSRFVPFNQLICHKSSMTIAWIILLMIYRIESTLLLNMTWNDKAQRVCRGRNRMLFFTSTGSEVLFLQPQLSPSVSFEIECRFKALPGFGLTFAPWSYLHVFVCGLCKNCEAPCSLLVIWSKPFPVQVNNAIATELGWKKRTYYLV